MKILMIILILGLFASCSDKEITPYGNEGIPLATPTPTPTPGPFLKEIYDGEMADKPVTPIKKKKHKKAKVYKNTTSQY